MPCYLHVCVVLLVDIIYVRHYSLSDATGLDINLLHAWAEVSAACAGRSAVHALLPTTNMHKNILNTITMQIRPR